MSLLIPITVRDITDRLDSFEKEVIELKAFRKAVEATSPGVAAAAQQLIEKHGLPVKSIQANLSSPLTAEEFVDLNQFYAVQKPKRIEAESLLYITTPNNLLKHAAIVHREYLVAVACLARSLNLAPYGLSQMPSIKELKRWYQWTFHDMRNTQTPTDAGTAADFDNLVRRAFLRHYNVSTLLSDGLLELAKREQWGAVDDEMRSAYVDLEEFFDDFCCSRVRLRFLIGNYMYLSTQILNVKQDTAKSGDTEGITNPIFFNHNPNDYVGQICKKCSLALLLKCAIRNAQKNFDDAEIELRISGNADLTFVGIPYITYDILSAMIDDAVQANHRRQELYGTPCSKIDVTLAQREGSKSYVVRISDTAGGMPLSAADLSLTLWSTTLQTMSDDKCKTWIQSPIRLPYAYCAARVIGGDLTVASIEGYGTDRQLYLPSTGLLKFSI